MTLIFAEERKRKKKKENVKFKTILNLISLNSSKSVLAQQTSVEYVSYINYRLGNKSYWNEDIWLNFDYRMSASKAYSHESN